MVNLQLKYAGKLPLFSLPATTDGIDRVFGAALSKDKKEVLFPAFYPYHKRVIEDLKVCEIDLTIPNNIQEHINSENKNSLPELNPSFKFITTPFEHQIESLKFAVANRRSALLLDCGLGKSKIAIDLLRYQKQFLNGGKAIVVCPKAILFNWQAEVAKHSGGELTATVLDGTPKKKSELLKKDTDIYIVTYSSLAKKEFLNQIIESIPYNTVILDESHNLQTPSSQKTKACLTLATKAERRVIMSGTVTLGSPLHLYGQLKFLGNFLIPEGDPWKYANRFITYAEKFNHRVPVGYKNMDVLQRRLEGVSVTYTKTECLDLPERYIIDVPYEVSEEQRTEYNSFVEASISEVAGRLNIGTESAAAVRLIKLKQILSGYRVESNKNGAICDGCEYVKTCVQQKIYPYTKQCKVAVAPPPNTIHKYKNSKIIALQNLLESIFAENNNKVIIWAYFHRELDDIEVLLQTLGIKGVRIDGSKSAGCITEDIRVFESDPETRALVGQVASGTGWSANGANFSIYYGLDFSLGNYNQSLDRCYRIGQERNVTVYRLFAPGSVDEYVLRALDSKENIASALKTGEVGISDALRYIVRPKPL